MAENASRLARRLSLRDAIFLGLGSMVGAGIFAAAHPAVRVSGGAVLTALGLAWVIAALNARSMVQLAVELPESGGTYAYAKQWLGSYWGFLAGWCFVLGKWASCAAMALTFGHYLFPHHPRAAAIGLVFLLSAVNTRGIRKTSTVNQWLVTAVFLVLGFFLFACGTGGSVVPERLSELRLGGPGLLQATGLWFFAFAGYARVATLAEEVKEPKKNIGRAIFVSLALSGLFYFAVTGALLLSLDLTEIAASPSPLARAIAKGYYAGLAPLLRIGAGIACASVLLSLLAGVSRTIFAMSTKGDLPRWLGQVDPKHRVPRRAEGVVALMVVVALSLFDLRLAIGFSSFGVLLYYAIAHACAWKSKRNLAQGGAALIGLVTCLTIAFQMPFPALASGGILVALGSLAYFFLVGRANTR